MNKISEKYYNNYAISATYILYYRQLKVKFYQYHVTIRKLRFKDIS